MTDNAPAGTSRAGYFFAGFSLALVSLVVLLVLLLDRSRGECVQYRMTFAVSASDSVRAFVLCHPDDVPAKP